MNVPLHYRSQHKDPQVLIELLRGNDLHLDVVNRHGSTPLGITIESNNFESAKILLESGANLDNTKVRGIPALIYASSWEKGRLVPLLLEYGANQNIFKKDGKGPLHLATIAGNIEAITALLEKDADVNRPDDNGNTPLHLVEYSREVVAVLLEKGADVNRPNNDGNTPLHMAVQTRAFSYRRHWDALDILLLLLDSGADVAEENARGQTPEDIAKEEWQDRVSRLIIATLNDALVKTKCSETSKIGSRCWKQIEGKDNCFMWDDHYHPKQIVKWSGKCIRGVAVGRGKMIVTTGGDEELPSVWRGRGTGVLSSGRYSGKWTFQNLGGELSVHVFDSESLERDF